MDDSEEFESAKSLRSSTASLVSSNKHPATSFGRSYSSIMAV